MGYKSGFLATKRQKVVKNGHFWVFIGPQKIKIRKIGCRSLTKNVHYSDRKNAKIASIYWTTKNNYWTTKNHFGRFYPIYWTTKIRF